MGKNKQPKTYWDLLESHLDAVDLYGTPEAFLTQFNRLPLGVGQLLAAHYAQSEINNGGLHQLFANSTGVLAPESAAAFQAMGLVEWAGVLREAMAFFGETYPREREARRQRLPASQPGQKRRDWDPFYALDERFYAVFRTHDTGWDEVADAYATQAWRSP